MVKGIITRTEDGKLLLTLAKEFFMREAVFAVAHKYSNHCNVSIFPVGEYEVGVWLSPKTMINEAKLQGIAEEFSTELIDQQIRLDLEKRNGRIRELIVKHAFAPLDNIDDEVRKG
jgi:His-Xaa-Ser system protein HxsD